MDDVLSEAIEAHRLQGVSLAMLKLNEDFDTDEKVGDKYRYLRASILPE